MQLIELVRKYQKIGGLSDSQGKVMIIGLQKIENSSSYEIR